MEVSFQTEKLASTCNAMKELVRTYGPEGAKRIRLRLTQLAAATCLEDLRNAPGRCHELAGGRSGCLSLDLHGPYRLIFRPARPADDEREEGGLDWQEVTEVVVIEIIDPH